MRDLLQTKLRILIVEDHPDLAGNIGDYLEGHGHVPDFAKDGLVGLHVATTGSYDAIVLDVMLPGLDGLSLCRKLRDAGDATPILMLTARDTVPDKLEAFGVGADDYLAKPCALQELEVRLQALARRARPNRGQVLRVGDLELNLGTLRVTRAGEPLELNPASLKVLAELMRASPNVVSKKQLETALWGDQPSGADALRTQIYALRQVVDKPFERPLLRTVHGIGYRLYDDHESAAA